MRLAGIRKTKRELHYFQLRLGVAGVVVLAAFTVLFGRFFYLQVIQHQYYDTLAESNRISIVPIVPNRGLILDRNGVVLARNYSGHTLEINLNKTADVEASINDLSTLVSITNKDRKRFKKLLAESHSFEALVIRNRLSDEEVARFAAQQYRFPAVEIKAR